MTRRKQQDYGLDVKWQASEGRAFVLYNRMCADQAKAIFAWHRNPAGEMPAVVPAAALAAEARRLAA